MKLTEKLIARKKVVVKEESDVAKMIKDLQATDMSGSNEEQIKAVELLKGLAVSKDSMASNFLKELGKHIKMIKLEELSE